MKRSWTWPAAVKDGNARDTSFQSTDRVDKNDVRQRNDQRAIDLSLSSHSKSGTRETVVRRQPDASLYRYPAATMDELYILVGAQQ